MKRLMAVLLVLVLLTFVATPAFAQGENSGDAVCTGGNMTIHAGETVDSVVLFGCNVIIEGTARVRQDVVAFGGNVTINADGVVDHDVVLFGGNVHSAGQIQHDVLTFGGNITLDPTAVVGHNVVTLGGNLTQREGAVVRGRINRTNTVTVNPFRFAPTVFTAPFDVSGGVFGMMASATLGFLRNLITAIALAALGALTVVFLPVQTKQVGDVAEKSALPSLGVGCLTMIVFVPLLLLLVILIITIPIAMLMPLALAVAFLFGWIAIGRVVGEKLLEAMKVREILPIAAVAVGVVILAILSAVPVIGWLIGVFAGLIGLGAVILTRFGTRPYPMTPVYAPIVPVAPTAPVAPAAPTLPAAPTPPATSNQSVQSNESTLPSSGEAGTTS